MADKAEKKPEEKPKAEAAAPAAAGAAAGHGDEKKAAKGGLLTKTPVIMGGVMLLEAVVLFAGFKFLGGGAPKAVQGADLAATDGHGDAGHGEGGHDEGHGDAHGEHGSTAAAPKIDKKKIIEIEVVKLKATNSRNGRTILYDVTIMASTKGENKEKVESAIKDRNGFILNQIRTIIAQSDPEKLNGGAEPGLETLRRQVKYQLDEIVGEGIIDDVLVPNCMPYPAGL